MHLLEEHIVLEKIIEIRRELPKTGCIKLHKELNCGFLQAHGITIYHCKPIGVKQKINVKTNQ